MNFVSVTLQHQLLIAHNTPQHVMAGPSATLADVNGGTQEHYVANSNMAKIGCMPLKLP